MLRSTLSYLSFGLVSESVESESVAEIAPVPVENESKVEVTTRPVEDNWVILGQDLAVSLIFKMSLHRCTDLYHIRMAGGPTSNYLFFKIEYSRIQSASQNFNFFRVVETLPIKQNSGRTAISGRSRVRPGTEY